MADYKSMYYHLAGRIAGTVEALEAITDKLKLAQQTTEDMFIGNAEKADDNSE
jgi:hypothetical protein